MVDSSPVAVDPLKKEGFTLGMVPIVAALAFVVAAPAWVAFSKRTGVKLWSTLFVSISLQAVPFLVLGVVLSGAIAAYLPSGFLNRIVPNRALFAVPAAGFAGMALPGCECGSVPIAGRLIKGGMPPAAALTFLLAAPAINPVVLVSTAVAFPRNHSVVLARFLASFLTAVIVGWWCARRIGSGGIEALTGSRPESIGHADGLTRHSHTDDHDHGHGHDDLGGAQNRFEQSTGGQSNGDTRNTVSTQSFQSAQVPRSSSARWQAFCDAASRDLVHAGGYLVAGAATATSLQLLIPRSALDSAARNSVNSIGIMAMMAVLLSVCSEADAFVAAGLPQFSLTSRLVFMVVGPVLDLKLLSMQVGTFGRHFALRFAPVSFSIAVLTATVMGSIFLR